MAWPGTQRCSGARCVETRGRRGERSSEYRHVVAHPRPPRCRMFEWCRVGVLVGGGELVSSWSGAWRCESDGDAAGSWSSGCRCECSVVSVVCVTRWIAVAGVGGGRCGAVGCGVVGVVLVLRVEFDCCRRRLSADRHPQPSPSSLCVGSHGLAGGSFRGHRAVAESGIQTCNVGDALGGDLAEEVGVGEHAVIATL